MWTREQRDVRTLGDWTFELRGDEIADLRWQGRTVLRSVRAVVRDRDWNTAPLVVDRIRETEATLTLHVRSEALGSSFAGVVRVEARPAGIVVICDLETAETFDTNRTGLVVLHPPHLSGVVLRVAHPDGRVEETGFPREISPHQPVQDIAALTWLDDGLEVAVEFTGDVFEMEDQRNWTDASFKTYSRPLALPFPYRLEAGERVVQQIAVAVRAFATSTTDAGAAAGADAADTIDLVAGGVFPEVTVGASTAPSLAGAMAAPAGPTIGASRLVELDLAWAGWPAALQRAADAGLPLDVRLVIADADPAGSLRAAARALRGVDVVRVTAFWPTGPARHVADAEAIALLHAALVDAEIGGQDADHPASAPRPAVVGGVRSHFTELNREHHRLPEGLAGVVFSVTPLFHSLDTAQLVESVAMQRIVAQQAVGLAGAAPVHIGPISLRPHFNDVATTRPPLPEVADLSQGYGPEVTDAADERQAAPELAAWTIASAAALAVPGVATLSYFEEWGPRGIRTAAGDDLPVAAALRALDALAGTTLVTGATPDGLVWAVGGAHDDGRATVLVANLDTAERTVRLGGAAPGATVTVGAGAWASHR